MNSEDLIYSRAKERLRTYGRINGKSTNERVIYECAIVIYYIKLDYREDTRNYYITQNIYEREIEMIMQLQHKIRHHEENATEAMDSCQDALTYIDLVVRPRINISSQAC